MDYDDNDFQGQNLNLAGEGSLKFSPVLRPYAIPKFEFDDSLQGHLRFDSLVENEVFLGIPSQDDNQWIEDFSRGSSGIEFDSGATESCSISRPNNVWSEATSSESVEMLLKSVGQEERVVGETIIEETYVGDDLGNLTNPMESIFKQDEGSNHAKHSASAPDVLASDVGVDPKLQSEEVEPSGCELGSDIVIGNFQEKNDLNGDDVNEEVIDNAVNETVNNEIPDPSVSASDCGNAHSSEDLTDQDNQQQVSEIGVRNVPEGVWRSVEKHDITDTRAHMGVAENQITENAISDAEVPTSSHLKEGCEYNVTDSFSLDASLHEPSLLSEREVTLTCNLAEYQQVAGNTPLESTVVIPDKEGSGMHAIEVDNTSSEVASRPEPERNSLVQTTDVQSCSVVEKENAIGIDGEEDTGALVSKSATSMLSVSGDKWFERGDVSSTGHVSDSTILVTANFSGDLVAEETRTENLKIESNANEVVKEESNAKDHGPPPISFDTVQIHQENPSFELDEVHMDQDVSVLESGSAKLSEEPSDMKCEVVGVLDSPDKPVSISSGETSGNIVVAQGADDHTTTETEPAMKETKFESHETLDANEDPSGINSTNDIDTGHDDQPKSPILGVSHQMLDDKEGMDVDVPSEASPLNGASQASAVPDLVSESPTFEVKGCTSADYAGKVQHEIDDQCSSGIRVSQSEQPSVVIEVVQGGSNEMETSSTPCGSVIKEGDETDNSKETTTEIIEQVQNLPDNSLNDHQASVDSTLPSKGDVDHVVQEESNSVILDKNGCDSPTVISCVELSHNAKDNCDLGKDTIQENIYQSEVTDNVEDKIQSVSPNLCENRSSKEEMSFSFEVSPSVSLGDAAKVWQSFPTIQSSNIPTIAEGSASKSVVPQADPMMAQEVFQCSPQTLVGGITKGGAKGTTERKARRKSGGKDSAKKGTNVKETSANQSERSENLSASLATAGTGTVLQFEESKSYESIELDAKSKNPSGVVSIPASSVPDLNTSASLSQQPFTDMQQVQLRAQILVYGSLIQGSTPDEACMIAAFGPSDGGRSPWEPAWRASIERLLGRKSMGNKIDTPVHSRSGITTPDQAVKHGSAKSKGPSSTTGRGKKKGPGTPSPVLSPMIPLSSPLWNMSTPSAEGLQAGSIARGAHLDYHQSLSPLHPYQTPPMQNFVGHNPSWLSHGPFPGQWVAAPPTSPFNISGRMSTLPPTEAVKLTPVKESGGPDTNRAPIPVVYSSGSSVFAGASPLPDLKMPTISSVLPIGDSKSRKRKKVSITETVGQIALPGQTQTQLVSTPVFIGDLSKKAESHGQNSLLAQGRTESVSVPVVSGHFSTAVDGSTTASFNSKNTPEKFPSSITLTPSNDQPKSGDKNAEEKVIVLPIGDSKSRKRKKVPTIEPVGQIAVPGQTQLVSTPVFIGDLSKKAESHGQNSLLAQSRTELTVPVSSSIFSTPVAVPTTASFNSKFTPDKFPFTVTPAPPNDQPKSGDQKAEEKVIVPPVGDSKSRKRKKVPTTEPVGQIALPGQTQTKLVSAPLIIGDLSKKIESHGQISMPSPIQTKPLSVPVVNSLFSTSVVVSATANNSKITPEKFPSAVIPTPSNQQSKTGDQNAEGKVIVSEEAFNKVEEAKVLAEEAAKDAASAISRCQSVWSQLEKQKNSGLASDAEVKLASAAVSIAAAASVAKAAAAAAKIASNAAEQARLMAYEVLASSGSENFSQSRIISLPNDVTNYGKATPASILKGGDGSSQSSSIILAAREASRRRVEAASAASKHAENIDAIVKAAELAAEAVSQAGKIVAMGEPLPLSKLVASGPEGYWKTPQLTSEQQGVIAGNVTSHKSSTMSAEADLNISARPGPSDMEIETFRDGEVSENLIKDPMRVTDPILVSKTSHEKDMSGLRTHKAADMSKTIGVVPESEFGLGNASVSVQNEYKNTSGILEENIIKEGCLVEVFKDGGKFKGAWFAANVLNFRDGKAYLCYTELESDEGKLKEWVSLGGDGTKVPRVRIAHPMTTMKFDGTRKRRRGAVTDYYWNVGDRVDAWLHNCWCEGLVTEKDKNDETSLTVHFPAQGETSVVRAWHLRPTLIWKDEKWIEWSSSKGNHSSQGDTPKEKRIKLGYPSPELRGKQKAPLSFIPEENIPKLDGHNVEGEGRDRSQISVDHVASGKHEEARSLPLSAHEKVFNIGKNTKVEKKLESHRTIRSGLQKEGPRVIFGVPKPGKKQKFMDVSKHYNGDRGNKNDSANEPSKFSRYMMPQATGTRGWTNNFKNDNKEKQTFERKPRVFKTGKAAQNPSGRTLASNDNITSSAKFAPKGTNVTDNVVKNSASNDQSDSGEQNLVDFKSSSNTDDTSEGPVSSHARPADAPKRVLSSKARSERSNRGRLAPAGGKSTKVEVNDNTGPEVAEPRRSNRRIQPTSRLLEGLQSSLTISKIPAISHDRSHRGQNKATPKGR